VTSTATRTPRGAACSRCLVGAAACPRSGVDPGRDPQVQAGSYVLVSIFWFMLLFAWIWLLISIFGDLFRDHELSGSGKVLWALFLIVLPWLGVLV
jgi:hypothetical protein